MARSPSNLGDPWFSFQPGDRLHVLVLLFLTEFILGIAIHEKVVLNKQTQNLRYVPQLF
jgi:hypothetical protein